MASGPGLHIAYPVSWYRPDTKASCEQVVHTIAALTRRGHRVTLLAPTPAGSEPMTARTLADFFSIDIDFAVEAVASRWAGDSLFSGLGWVRQLVTGGHLRGFDMMLTRLPAVIGIRRPAPVPFAFDHYRPWPDIYPIARPFIRNWSKAADCIGLILHSSFAADSYLRAGVPSDRIIVAHNGAYGAALREERDRGEARRALGLDPAVPTVVYAGRVNEQKGLDQMLAMARLRPHVRFLIVGSEGDGPIEIEARTLPNVTVFSWQAADALPGFLAAADVLLIPPSSEPLRRFGNCVLPLKTFSYLAAGRPILAPALPDTAELLRDAETAMLVQPDDPVAAAQALDTLMADTVLAARLGANARLLAERNSWDARAERLDMFFHRRLEEMAGVSRGFVPELVPA